ncbi:MAG: 5-methylthioadenosine/S-adenosylhomocysteine deaminase [Solirubrobacterales bacterium]|jgi:5-methylthioadenosine/S-adenosylhomocysteine deaminase|nr:5-methylthioadenosine/S-adenosylhomocysteine deaminase [Solirubrobacterales bacterium]
MSALVVIDARTLDGERVGLRCDADGTIAALGPDVVAEPDEKALDAAGAILVPPLVNGHTHAAMTLFRGSGGDLPLMPWLEERIWPVEAKLEPDDVYWGTRLACLEMIRSGTTRFWDMYWHPEATARAVAGAGLRATIGAPMFDKGRNAKQAQAEARESLETLSALGGPITAALAPHSIYMVSEESLGFLAELSAASGAPLQIHLSETKSEVDDCIGEHGRRPAAYLDDLGLLTERALLAHGVWLDDEELDLIAARGATVVSNPAANMKLAVGKIFDWPSARAAGVQVGLGTDGAGSNDSLDLLADLKLFALAQRHAAADATAIAVDDAWAIATGAKAPLLGATPLAVGEPADFLLLDPASPELAIGELTADLVYAADRTAVDTVVVAGQVLMRGGVQPERAEVVAKAAERASRLGL